MIICLLLFLVTVLILASPRSKRILIALFQALIAGLSKGFGQAIQRILDIIQSLSARAFTGIGILKVAVRVLVVQVAKLILRPVTIRGDMLLVAPIQAVRPKAAIAGLAALVAEFPRAIPASILRYGLVVSLRTKVRILSCPARGSFELLTSSGIYVSSHLFQHR